MWTTQCTFCFTLREGTLSVCSSSSMAYKRRVGLKTRRRRPYVNYRRRSYRRSVPSRTVGRRYVRRSRSMGTGSMKIPQFLAANLNPFDMVSRGVRCPDTNSTPSSGFHVLDSGYVNASNLSTTVANGLIMNVFRPYVNNPVVLASTSSTSAVAWTANLVQNIQAAKYAAVLGQYELFRAVAHGVKLTCPLAPTAAAGNIHICLYTPRQITSGTTFPYPTSVAEMRECPFYQKFTLASLTQNPICIANKFCDITGFRYYQPGVSDQVADTTAAVAGVNQVPGGWMHIIVALDGTGLTSRDSGAIQFENLVHCEGQAIYSGLNGDNNAEPSNSMVLDGTAAAIAQMDPVYADTASDVTRHVNKGVALFAQDVSGGNRPEGVNIPTGSGGASSGGISGVNINRG